MSVTFSLHLQGGCNAMKTLLGKASMDYRYTVTPPPPFFSFSLIDMNIILLVVAHPVVREVMA